MKPNQSVTKPRVVPVLLMVLGLFWLALASQFVSADQKVKRTIIGYSSELTVRPGDSVEFMVSALGGGSYTADLVRVINGDKLSRYRNMFRVEPVDVPFAGRYDGIEQPLDLGSYVQVDNTAALDKLKSFTVGAWIFPVFDPTEYTPPDLENIDPLFPPTLNIGPLILHDAQTVVSRFDKTTGTGWALRINKGYQLEFVVGSGDGKLHTVRIEQTVRDWDWSYVSASYDAKNTTVTVRLQDKPWAPGDRFTARKLQASGKVANFPQRGPLRIAAARDGAGTARARF